MIGGYISNARIGFPCRNCTARKVGCHAKCEAYQKVAELHVQLNEARYKAFAPIVHEPASATRRRWQRRKKGYAGRDKS